jgi:hypothetical protein
MNRLLARSIPFLLILPIVFLAYPSNKSSVSANPVESPGAAKGMTLDVVLAGPFVIVEQANGVVVYLPDIEDHNPPTAITSGDLGHIRTLQRGDYDFTKGVNNNSGKITALNPVPGAQVFTVSASAEHLSTPPLEKPYLSIKLPRPREVVPWNADPLQISDQSPVLPSTPKTRYATVTILRFDSLASDIPEMDGPNDFVWKPKAKPLGTDRIVTIVVEPVQEDDNHTHGHNAFRHMTTLLGLKRFIEFPPIPASYIRNIPLTANVLPPQLVNALPGDKNKLNDCKAAGILVEP